jgi:acyl-coenzyme A thioesterase PaaI-like protein
MHSGEPGIVHGGIQATILDEVLGRAAQRAVIEIAGQRRTIVTASFELRYRSPCVIDERITARAWVERVEWPSVHVRGELTDATGCLLTEGNARWRVIRS